MLAALLIAAGVGAVGGLVTGILDNNQQTQHLEEQQALAEEQITANLDFANQQADLASAELDLQSQQNQAAYDQALEDLTLAESNVSSQYDLNNTLLDLQDTMALFQFGQAQDQFGEAMSEIGRQEANQLTNVGRQQQAANVATASAGVRGGSIQSRTATLADEARTDISAQADYSRGQAEDQIESATAEFTSWTAESEARQTAMDTQYQNALTEIGNARDRAATTFDFNESALDIAEQNIALQLDQAQSNADFQFEANDLQLEQWEEGAGLRIASSTFGGANVGLNFFQSLSNMGFIG